MNVTTYEEVNGLIDQISAQIQKNLGDKLVGLYLFGSTTTGDFDIDSSDIDLLAAVKEDITEQEFGDLKKMHDDFALKHPKWKGRIEVIYISIQGLQTFKTQRSKIAVINPGELFRITDAGRDEMINWYSVQEKGIVLFGPDQINIIAHISKDEYVNDLKDHALSWRERIKSFDEKSSPGGLAYSIFTMCRAMYGVKNGEQVSKKKAAEWAAREFPQWVSLLDAAAIWRKRQWDEKQNPVGSYFPKVIEFVNFAIDQIIGISETKPTPYKDVNKVLEELTKGLVKILGENLVGLHLTGSLTYGDFDRGSSDIDFLAVLNKEFSEQQFEAVGELHSHIGNQYPEWAKRTEGSYITRSMLSSIEPPPNKRPYVNWGIINNFRYGNEWVLNLFVLRECGVALYGPAPKDLFPQISIEIVRAASRQDLFADWEPKLHKEDPFFNKSFDSNHLRAYATLTLCRILYRQLNDEVASKLKASNWVKKIYPQWKDLVEKAENWKHGEKMEDEEEIKDFIRFAVSKVK